MELYRLMHLYASIWIMGTGKKTPHTKSDEVKSQNFFDVWQTVSR